MDRNEINQDGLLRWLLTAVLVLGLISFSGSVSESASAGIERTKTELRATSSVNRAKAVDFQNVRSGLIHPFWQISGQTTDFSSYLIEFESNIRAKAKSSLKVFTTVKLQVRRFLKYYSSTISGDPAKKG